MGLLDEIMAGRLPTSEGDPQGALLNDLLARLAAGQAQPGSMPTGPYLRRQVAEQSPPEDATVSIGNPGRFARPGLAGETPSVTPVAAPAPARMEPPKAEPMPPMREVGATPAVGEPYKAPEAAIVPDDIRRREAAAKLNPALAAPAARKPAVPEGESFADKLVSFSQGYNKGGLVGAIGEAMGGQGNNATVRALMRNLSIDKETATAIASNPALAPIIFGGKGAPQVVDIPGPYGTSVKGVFDPTTRTIKPLSTILSPELRGVMPETPAAPAPTPVLGGMSPASPSPAAPVAPGGHAMPAAPGIPAPAPGLPAASPGAPAAPAAAAPADTIVGAGVPTPPAGYVHKMSPDGRGFLYDRKTGQPVFETKAEAEARAKGTEKRALDRVDQEQQVEGVRKIVAQARGITDAPGFDGALTLGNMSLTLGLPTPLGTIGGDVANPVKQIARMWDKSNPSWSVSDDITSLQQQLNLIVARPLMKGQGNVSNSEREMISDAIGGLSKATSKADFQFRLNNIESMVEAMQTGQPGAVSAAVSTNRRPTQSEIVGAVDLNGQYGPKFRPGAVEELATKYRMRPADMQQYINETYIRSQGGK